MLHRQIAHACSNINVKNGKICIYNTSHELCKHSNAKGASPATSKELAARAQSIAKSIKTFEAYEVTLK